jgi:hypothetical protein
MAIVLLLEINRLLPDSLVSFRVFRNSASEFPRTDIAITRPQPISSKIRKELVIHHFGTAVAALNRQEVQSLREETPPD